MQRFCFIIVILCFSANHVIYGQKLVATPKPYPFKTVINQIDIAGRSVTLKDAYSIGYEDNALAFYLGTKPHLPNVKYKYRIVENSFEGDKKNQWVYISNKSIKIDTLSPAIYRFEVSANDDEQRNGQETYVEFKREHHG